MDLFKFTEGSYQGERRQGYREIIKKNLTKIIFPFCFVKNDYPSYIFSFYLTFNHFLELKDELFK